MHSVGKSILSALSKGVLNFLVYSKTESTQNSLLKILIIFIIVAPSHFDIAVFPFKILQAIYLQRNVIPANFNKDSFCLVVPPISYFPISALIEIIFSRQIIKPIL